MKASSENTGDEHSSSTVDRRGLGLVVGGIFLSFGLVPLFYLYDLFHLFTFLGIMILLWKSRSVFIFSGFWIVSIILPLVKVARIGYMGWGIISAVVVWVGAFVALIGFIDICVNDKIKKYLICGAGSMILIFNVLFFQRIVTPWPLCFLTSGVPIAIVIFCGYSYIRAEKTALHRDEKPYLLELDPQSRKVIYITGSMLFAVALPFINLTVTPVIAMIGAASLTIAASLVPSSRPSYFIAPIGYLFILLFGLSGPKVHRFFHHSPPFFIFVVLVATFVLFLGYDVNHVPFEDKGIWIYSLSFLLLLLGMIGLQILSDELYDPYTMIFGAISGAVVVIKGTLTFMHGRGIENDG